MTQESCSEFFEVQIQTFVTMFLLKYHFRLNKRIL